MVIDVESANFIPDSSRKSGSRMVGDVDFESVLPVASLVTPVPGGVGPMTVANLFGQCCIAAKSTLQKNNETPKFTKQPKLNLQKPVPSDFEISRAQEPKRINQVAAEAGILRL